MSSKKYKKRKWNKVVLTGATMSGIVLASVVAPNIPLLSSPIEAEASETISITQDTTAKKMIESSQIRVWMQSTGRYGIQLKSNGATIFYNTDSAYLNITRNSSFPNGYTYNQFSNLSLKSFVVNGTTIEQTRTDGVFDYIFRLSIVNANSQGAYMKAEVEMKNLTSSSQLVGASFNMDTQVNGNDQSPFRIIQNGWDAFYGGVQVTAYYQNVFNVTNADAIYLGYYYNQYPMPVDSFYPGQPDIYPGDSGAGFYYNPKYVGAYQTRKESWIMGLGPRNVNPSFTMTAPSDNQTFYRGQTLPIKGTAQDTDVGDVLEVKWAIDGGAENLLTSFTANGLNQAFNYNYTLPSNLMDGWHTLQVWVMDDKGGVSSSNTKQFYINNFIAPDIPMYSDVKNDSFVVSFDKKGNVNSTTYELYRVHNGTMVNMGTGTSINEKGLNPNTLYQYKVRAKNTSDVYTAYSAVSSIYTLANKPTAISLNASVNGQAGLSWGANGNPNGTKYHYEVRRSSDNAVAKSGDTTSTSATITGLPTDVDYKVYVKALNGDNVSTEEAYLGQMYQDTVAPSMTFATSTSAWTKGSVTITATATDSGSGVKRIQLPNGNWVAGSSVTYTAPSNGVYTFSVEDNTGNVKSYSVSVSNIDNQKPNAPSISVSNIWTNASSVPVTVSHGADNGTSGVNRTEYMLSGATSKDWTTYTGQISITNEGETIITARTIDNAGNISDTYQQVVKIDRTAPAIPTVNTNGYISGEWSKENVTLTTSLADSGHSDAKVQYALTGGKWADFDGSITFSNEGTETISFRSVDEAGNTSGTILYTVKIDKGNPSATATKSTSAWTKDNVVIKVTATDGMSGVKSIKLPDGTVVNSSNTTYTATENGLYNFVVTDNAGRTFTLPVSVENVDKEKPNAPTVNANENWATENVDVSMSDNGDNGGANVSRVEYMLSGATTKSWTTYVSPITISNQGLTTITSRVVDSVGNISDVTTKTVKIDKGAPVITETISPTTWTNDRVTINIDATDSISGVKSIELPNGNKVNGTNTASYTVDRNGDYTFTVMDNSGNVTTKTISIDNIDKNPPNATHIIEHISDDSFKIVLTANDDASGVKSIKLPNGELSYGNQATFTVKKGQVYNFELEDKAGNKKLYEIKIDVPELNVYQRDEHVKAEWEMDMLEQETIITTNLFRGNTKVYEGLLSEYEDKEATDKAKPNPVTTINVEARQGDIFMNIQKPEDKGTEYEYTLKAISDKGNSVASEKKKVTVVSGTDGYSYVIDTNTSTIPDDTIDLRSDSVQVPITDNRKYYIHIKSIDKAGNVSDVAHVPFQDSVAPTMSLTQNPTTWTTSTIQITVEATDQGLGMNRIKLPNGTWVKGSNATYSVTENGTYTFVAEDLVGNQTTKSITISNIDTVVPTVPKISNNQEWINAISVPVSIQTGTDIQSGVNRVEYKLEGKSVQGWTEYTKTFSITNEGETKIKARTIDNVGNISEEVSSYVRIDRSTPHNVNITIHLQP